MAWMIPKQWHIFYCQTGRKMDGEISLKMSFLRKIRYLKTSDDECLVNCNVVMMHFALNFLETIFSTNSKES